MNILANIIIILVGTYLFYKVRDLFSLFLAILLFAIGVSGLLGIHW